VDVRKFDDWIRLLDSDQLADRDRARKALADLGMAAEPLLVRTAEQTRSVEVRAGVNRLLARLEPELRRATHAIEMLEMIGTAPARQLLAQIAKGSADATLTREAVAALNRLERRR
jgi:hypothetical protein